MFNAISRGHALKSIFSLVYKRVFFVDFRSLVAYRAGEEYVNCTNTGFFDAYLGWSINFDIIYMNNQYCKWYIYNPNPTGSVILSFPLILVKYFTNIGFQLYFWVTFRPRVVVINSMSTLGWIPERFNKA